jgi:hypothetical protein
MQKTEARWMYNIWKWISAEGKNMADLGKDGQLV